MTTETTVTTVLQRTRTTLCSGILRGPSGGGVAPAGEHKKGRQKLVREESLSRPGHLILLKRSSCWSAHLAGAFVLLECSSCWSVRLREPVWPVLVDVVLVLLTTTESSSNASPRRNRKGRPPVSGFGSPLAGPTSLKTARGGQVRDRPQ